MLFVHSSCRCGVCSFLMQVWCLFIPHAGVVFVHSSCRCGVCSFLMQVWCLFIPHAGVVFVHSSCRCGVCSFLMQVWCLFIPHAGVVFPANLHYDDKDISVTIRETHEVGVGHTWRTAMQRPDRASLRPQDSESVPACIHTIPSMRHAMYTHLRIQNHTH